MSKNGKKEKRQMNENEQEKTAAVEKAEVEAALSEAAAMDYARQLAENIRKAKDIAAIAGVAQDTSETVKNWNIAICETADLVSARPPEKMLTAIHALVLLASEKFGGEAK